MKKSAQLRRIQKCVNFFPQLFVVLLCQKPFIPGNGFLVLSHQLLINSLLNYLFYSDYFLHLLFELIYSAVNLLLLDVFVPFQSPFHAQVEEYIQVSPIFLHHLAQIRFIFIASAVKQILQLVEVGFQEVSYKLFVVPQSLLGVRKTFVFCHHHAHSLVLAQFKQLI